MLELLSFKLNLAFLLSILWLFNISIYFGVGFIISCLRRLIIIIEFGFLAEA